MDSEQRITIAAYIIADYKIRAYAGYGAHHSVKDQTQGYIYDYLLMTADNPL